MQRQPPIMRQNSAAKLQKSCFKLFFMYLISLFYDNLLMTAIPGHDIRYAFFVARVVWGSEWGKKCLPFRAEVLNGKQ